MTFGTTLVITVVHFTGKSHFVMEFATGGDLRSLLQVMQLCPEPAAIFYAAETTLDLQFLHQQGIVHR